MKFKKKDKKIFIFERKIKILLFLHFKLIIVKQVP